MSRKKKVCRNCFYWPSYGMKEYGLCKHPKVGVSELKVFPDHDEIGMVSYGHMLKTGKDFGCIHFSLPSTGRSPQKKDSVARK